MGIIDDLMWRYATKKFDASKIVDQDKIDRIKEAINLSAGSPKKASASMAMSSQPPTLPCAIRFSSSLSVSVPPSPRGISQRR